MDENFQGIAIRINHDSSDGNTVSATQVKPTVTLAQVETRRDDLAKLLVEGAVIEAEWKAANEKFERENAALIARRDFVRAAIKGADAGLREQAVSYYQQNRDTKALTSGVAIEDVTVAVYDPAALHQYALHFMPDLLILNVKAVDDLALAIYAHKHLAAALAPMPLRAEKQPRAEISADKLRREAEVRGNFTATVAISA